MFEAVLSTDGGSRGNPGIAGLGIDLVDKDGSAIARAGWCIGMATNNVAEYSALVWGLQNAWTAGVSHILVQADSELIVKQINGQYRVKSPDLKPLYEQAKKLLSYFEKVRVVHVYRENNAQADEMANRAMDARGPVGSYLIAWGDDNPRLPGMPLGCKEVLQSACDKESALSGLSYDESKDNGASLFHDESEENTTMQDQKRGVLSGKTFVDRGGSYEMTVKDHFDAAHSLPGYDGPCRNLHGHTWDIEATVCGLKLDAVGILYDFKHLKQDIHALLDNFDHGCVNEVKPFDSINPTAENLARVIYHELSALLPDHISLKQVVVWESPIAKVVYRI